MTDDNGTITTTDGRTVPYDAPAAELAHRDPDAAPVGLFGTSDPVTTIERATAVATVLTDVINNRKLYADMGRGKRHVTIEGWQTLGALLGVVTTIEWTRHALDEHEQWSPPRDNQPGMGGWEARAIATRDGRVMGTAEAECRWDESKWADRDSYAVRSMAQTRAQSKAYSAALRFIVTLAGFSGTPAEEMDGVHDDHHGPVLDTEGLDVTKFACPACGSDVFDNRPTNETRRAEGKNNMPSFKCRDRKCTGATADGESVTEGTVGEPWITWHDSFFYRRHPAVVDAMRRVYAAATNIGDFARQAWEEAATSFGFGMYETPLADIDDVTALAVTIASTYAGVDIDDPTGPPPPAPDTFDIDDDDEPVDAEVVDDDDDTRPFETTTGKAQP